MGAAALPVDRRRKIVRLWDGEIGPAGRRRIYGEIRNVCEGKWKEQLFALAVADHKNIRYLQGIIISPGEAPTGNYIFTLNIEISPYHPFKPPNLLFENNVWHPKVSPNQGHICLAEVTDEYWKPRIKLNTIGLSIAEMLRHPGEFKACHHLLNREAADQFWDDYKTYEKVALEWAKQDNSGYGMIQFEDLRLAAIQSCLAFPSLIPYECHVFCAKACTPMKLELIATVIPSLTIYREMVDRVYGSLLKLTTSSEFNFDDKKVAIYCSEFSRDKCWEISLSDSVINKAEVDKLDPRTDSPIQSIITFTWNRLKLEPVSFTEKIKIMNIIDESEIHSFDVHVDPTTLKTATPAGDQRGSKPPTITQLLSLPSPSGKRINLTEVVGARYFEFGVHLLNDETGELVESLEIEHQKVPKNIVRNILTLWLQGRGKEVTWSVLVECLESIGDVELAGNIKQLYDS